MKITIVTDSHGNSVGALQGHAFSEQKGGVKATVSFQKGHKLHKLEVEEDFATITDPEEFYRKVLKHVPKH